MTIGTIYAQNPMSNTLIPKAIKQAQKLTIHGHERVDDYYWMNQRDSKEVLAHLVNENAYANSYFTHLEDLQQNLLDEFEKRIDPNDKSAPFILNGITYQSRNVEGKDYALIYKLEGLKETVYLDENERAKNQSFYELADWSPSPNNELLAISEDYIGPRKYTIRIRDNKTGRYLKDVISDSDGSIVWANDNKTIFYVKIRPPP